MLWSLSSWAKMSLSQRHTPDQRGSSILFPPFSRPFSVMALEAVFQCVHRQAYGMMGSLRQAVDEPQSKSGLLPLAAGLSVGSTSPDIKAKLLHSRSPVDLGDSKVIWQTSLES
eukprot:GHVS01058178.1.p1 GENE.GHVS01058178.1~~GHVS01058178.1.p1  ORF type:complete len:114 (-),score=0.47 GHVS01058178.1:235-576(-)